MPFGVPRAGAHRRSASLETRSAGRNNAGTSPSTFGHVENVRHGDRSAWLVVFRPVNVVVKVGHQRGRRCDDQENRRLSWFPLVFRKTSRKKRCVCAYECGHSSVTKTSSMSTVQSTRVVAFSVRYLPGSLAHAAVVPVQLDWACPRHSCYTAEVDGGTVYRASGLPRPIPGVPPARNLSGISFAVANETGILARQSVIGVGPGMPPASLLRELKRSSST